MRLGAGDLSMPDENQIASSSGARVEMAQHTWCEQRLPPRSRHGGTGQGRHAGVYAGVYASAPLDASVSINVSDAYEYCRRIARAIARTFYYGSLFLPAEKRRAVWALYAFCRTADDIADEPDLFPTPASELAHWRTGLLDLYAGNPRGPVMTAWADMLQRYPVPIQPALDLLDGVAKDIKGTTYETFDDLRLYCYQVAGTVGLLMAPVLGYVSDAALQSAIDLGIAMQLTNILRDLGEDSAVGRVYLPNEELRRFGYSRDELRNGVVNDRFRALMDFQIARAQAYYELGLRGVALLSPDARLAIALSGTLYQRILDRIRQNGYDVFSRRAHIPLTGKLAALPGVWLRLQRAGR